MHETAAILQKIRKIYPKEKILVLWDGAGWHCGSVAQQALVEHHIEAIHFSPYSPELNLPHTFPYRPPCTCATVVTPEAAVTIMVAKRILSNFHSGNLLHSSPLPASKRKIVA